ncbi:MULTISPECIES: hypothetical protein [unclassified Variovorax]|uniref:hypothetical protein n=1 Tax=unclassified Variovorax TaxID=663243 RepID=UPI001BD26B68|nr:MULTISPECIES: hypothetical protein [unclassified Variovorax]
MRATVNGDSQSLRKGSAPPLSRFEWQCLCQRMHECEALLQLAVLGVAQAVERHRPDSDLADIARCLDEAERVVEIARRIASSGHD